MMDTSARRRGARAAQQLLSLCALLLAALSLGCDAAGPGSSSGSSGGEGASSSMQASKHCLVDVYAAKNVSLTEYRYMATVIYAHIPHQCGCRILLKERDKAPAAIRRLKDYRQPAMVLVAARDIRAEELAAVEEAGPHARAKLVVVHQSDELNTYNTTWYPKVKAVFRNYHRSKQHLIQLTRYLKQDPAGWSHTHHRLGAAAAHDVVAAAAGGAPGGAAAAPHHRRPHHGAHAGAAAAAGGRRRAHSASPFAAASAAVRAALLGTTQASPSSSSSPRRRLHTQKPGRLADAAAAAGDGSGRILPRQMQGVSSDLSRPAERDENVFWVPLGFGECFVASPAMHAEVTARPLLWSWTGSLGKKPERKAMVRALNTSELLKHGVLHTYESFKGPEMLPPVKYSTLLYESKLVPLPPGLHPEQFRLYEALAAGAIPMILKEHANAGLAHVDVLGFKAVWLDTWKDAPKVMLELLSNEALQHELNAWQAHNSMQYVRVMRLVRQTFAEQVCRLSELHVAP